MVYVILYEDENGRQHVSHGVDSETLEIVVLPQEPWDIFRVNCILTKNGYVLKND